MLKENMSMYIEQLSKEHGHTIKLFAEQERFAKKHDMLSNVMNISLVDPVKRFENAYLERCEKETEALILIEAPIFLKQPITHFKDKKHEFLLIESNHLHFIGVDALSIEVDDVFDTYTALFGLKLKKKFKTTIQEYITSHLESQVGNFSMAFSEQDGLWDINIAINCIEGYHADMTIGEACELVYQWIFNLVEFVETNS